MQQSRSTFALGLIGCIIAVGTALAYFQNYLGLIPCPLCILQRMAFFALGAVYLVATLHNPQGIMRPVYKVFAIITALIGGGVSAWHIRLQNLPAEEVPQCGPGLDFMLEVMPLDKVLTEIFTGSGECSEVLWSLFGITIPGWTLMTFIGFVLYGVWSLLTKK